MLLVKMHQDLQPVAGQDRPSVVWVFHGFGRPVVACLKGAAAPDHATPPPRLRLEDIAYAADLEPFMAQLDSPQAKLYIDVGAKGKLKIGLPISTADTVVALSAAAESDAIVAWKNKGALLVDRYLSNWSHAESERCRRLLRPDAASGEAVLQPLAGEPLARGVNAALLTARYQRYGGIARALFVDTDAGLQQRLDAALNECTLDKIVELASANALHQLVKGEFSSILFHYRVNEQAPLDAAARQAIHHAAAAGPYVPLPFQLLDPSVQLATDEIKELLFQKHAAAGVHAVVKFLNACIGHPALATIRGDMWQPYANHIMRQSPLLWRQKIDPETGVRIGPAFQYQFRVSGLAPLRIQRLADFQQLALQQYGIPMPANWPTLDAVLEPNISLQWTVSAKHSVNEGGLYDAYQQLQQKAAALAGGAAPAAFRLEHHFGVPQERFNQYSLTANDFEPVAGKPRPLNVDYFVLLVEDPSAAKKRKVRCESRPSSRTMPVVSHALTVAIPVLPLFRLFLQAGAPASSAGQCACGGKCIRGCPCKDGDQKCAQPGCTCSDTKCTKR